jgi:hypothetical protein
MEIAGEAFMWRDGAGGASEGLPPWRCCFLGRCVARLIGLVVGPVCAGSSSSFVSSSWVSGLVSGATGWRQVTRDISTKASEASGPFDDQPTARPIRAGIVSSPYAYGTLQRGITGVCAGGGVVC